MIIFKKLVVNGVETTLEEALSKKVEQPTIDTTETESGSANTVEDSLKIKRSSYLDDMTGRN